MSINPAEENLSDLIINRVAEETRNAEIPPQSHNVNVMLPGTTKWISLTEVLDTISNMNNGEAALARPRFKKRPSTGFKLQSKKIAREELVRALIHQKIKGGLIEEILVNLNLTNEEDIATELTSQHGFPYLPLENYDIDRDAIKMIPREVAELYGCIPIEKMGENLTVAMTNPLNSQAIAELERISRCMVLIFVSTASEIKKAIQTYYNHSDSNYARL